MTNQIIGRRIRSIRMEKGLTMEEFGEIFNPPASKGVICNWEKGRCHPNRERLRQFAEIGNSTVEELFQTDSKNCTRCEYEKLELDYKFCPICGTKVEV
ncbi:hypothetical protein IGI42_002503 [Enterococcus sp. AZ109]